MARIRTIKPDFFQNEQVGSVPFQWRLLFVGLWTQADREGRLLERPQRLKAMLFPYDDDLNIDDGLGCLASAGLITRYEQQGLRLIEIPTWAKHQQPHVREAGSTLPAPDDRESGASTVLEPVQPVGREQIRKGTDQEGNRDSPKPQNGSVPATAGPIFLEFPVVGKPGPSWAISEALVSEFSDLYPGLDVRQESRKALAWVLAAPGHRKTAGGMRRFLTGWMNRATNNGGARRHDGPTRDKPRPLDAARPDSVMGTDRWWVAYCLHEPKCRTREACLKLGKAS